MKCKLKGEGKKCKGKCTGECKKRKKVTKNLKNPVEYSESAPIPCTLSISIQPCGMGDKTFHPLAVKQIILGSIVPKDAKKILDEFVKEFINGDRNEYD